jgi:PiT family inorganic phosphate transporter
MLFLLFAATLFLAYSNGANDNFKGVATLLGGGVTTYRTAIILATVMTFAGSMSSLLLAQSLMKAFSGQRLVPDVIALSPRFLAAVAVGAGSAVVLATILGFPVSTTHGLIGALMGAGTVAAGTAIKPSILLSTFMAPLVLSPLLAIALTVPLYKFLHLTRIRLGITDQTCVCVGETAAATASDFAAATVAAPGQPFVQFGSAEVCRESYGGRYFGVSTQQIVDGLHYASASAVCFARGLNDTPKIAGLIFAAQALQIRFAIPAIALAMAIGGLLSARRVAQTMSWKIARMNDGQALTANFVTALLVIFASRLGLPVSTTHVSVGAITGVGLVNHTARARALTGILLSWLLTLPVAAAISGMGYLVLTALTAH